MPDPGATARPALHHVAFATRDLDETHRVRGVRRTDDHHGVTARGDLEQGGLSVGGREAQVAAAGHPGLGKPLAGGLGHVGPVAVRQGCLGEQCNRGLQCRKGLDLLDALHAVDGPGSHRHRPHGFLVALVAHVDDVVALGRTGLDLVVDLGDERAHRVDHEATGVACGLHDLRCGAVGRQHDRAPGWDVGDVVHEDHAQVLEAPHHDLVVDDLVVAVHRGLEGANHPGKGLDRHLDACTEPPGCSKQHLGDTGATLWGRVHRFAGCVLGPVRGAAHETEATGCPLRCRAALRGRGGTRARRRSSRAPHHPVRPVRSRALPAGASPR